MSRFGALAFGVVLALYLGAHGVADTAQMKTAVHLAERWIALATPGAFLVALITDNNAWKRRTQ